MVNVVVVCVCYLLFIVVAHFFSLPVWSFIHVICLFLCCQCSLFVCLYIYYGVFVRSVFVTCIFIVVICYCCLFDRNYSLVYLVVHLFVRSFFHSVCCYRGMLGCLLLYWGVFFPFVCLFSCLLSLLVWSKLFTYNK